MKAIVEEPQKWNSFLKLALRTCMEVDVKNPSNNTMGSEDVYFEQ